MRKDIEQLFESWIKDKLGSDFELFSEQELRLIEISFEAGALAMSQTSHLTKLIKAGFLIDPTTGESLKTTKPNPPTYLTDPVTGDRLQPQVRKFYNK